MKFEWFYSLKREWARFSWDFCGLSWGNMVVKFSALVASQGIGMASLILEIIDFLYSIFKCHCWGSCITLLSHLRPLFSSLLCFRLLRWALLMMMLFKVILSCLMRLSPSWFMGISCWFCTISCSTLCKKWFSWELLCWLVVSCILKAPIVFHSYGSLDGSGDFGTLCISTFVFINALHLLSIPLMTLWWSVYFGFGMKEVSCLVRIWLDKLKFDRVANCLCLCCLWY